MNTAVLYCGDAVDVLERLAAGSVQCVVTSPPYWRQRDYGVAGQLGQEAEPELYVQNVVRYMRAVGRVMAEDGVLWLNVDDSFVGKSLCVIPGMVARVMVSDGWLLRCDVIWWKPNAIPENVDDRPTRAHEYLFMFTRMPTYGFDKAVLAEAAVCDRLRGSGGVAPAGTQGHGGLARLTLKDERNGRSMWVVNTQSPEPEVRGHCAPFPEELVKRCVLSSSRRDDTVLDPFGGSGATAAVAVGSGRNAVYIDIKPEYLAVAERRIGPMFCQRVSL